ncbi:unnamed protein product [Haemonchus placei]|uniref:Uncharacterized protein n=1 Tax=Haemonchus placei TaxID=6290 RepID=A0A3P8A3X0_HAEPC|nr:unnamed protein product [Haemonchus placei]
MVIYSDYRTPFICGERFSKFLAAIWLYLKHREIVSYFSYDHQNSWQRQVSFANACIGLLGLVFLQLSVNFPVPYIQVSSNMMLLICSVVYVWVHTALSSFIIDRNIARTKLFLVRTSLAAAFTSCCGSGNSGAVYEWGAYFFMCLFLLTDAYEFRNLIFRAPKLVIPGAPLYNAERLRSHSPLLSPSLSFADLTNSALRVPLVL